MSARNNHIDYIELPAAGAKQLRQAKDFYAQVFAWKYKDWGEEYSDTSDSGVGSGINAGGDHRPLAPLPVVYAEDLAAARKSVQANGGKVTREIFSFPGGHRFHFTDPAGNELAVWSDK
jgi:predicted enzyme related to lactoylglutathione lyase